MKKWMAVFGVFMMLLVLVSCGAKEAAPVQDEVVQDALEETEVPAVEETAPVEEVEAEPEPEPEEEPVEEIPVEEEPVVEEPVEEEPAPEEPVKEDPVSDPPATSVDLSAVCVAMTSQMGITDGFTLDTSALMGLYGISADYVKQSCGYVTMSGTFPDEIIMVEAVESAAADAVQACLQTRLDAVLVQSQTYDAENYAAAQKCSVARNGLFVCLILSPKQADLAAIYSAYIG